MCIVAVRGSVPLACSSLTDRIRNVRVRLWPIGGSNSVVMTYLKYWFTTLGRIRTVGVG